MNSKRLEERAERHKLFVAEHLTRREIAEKFGLSYGGYKSYLAKHPELPKPDRQIGSGGGNREYNEKHRQKYENLILQGLCQSEIARQLKRSRQAINAYLEYHPELPRPVSGRNKK